MQTVKEKDTARSQEKAQLVSIVELMDNLETANERSGDSEAIDQAQQAIQENALDVLIRNEWTNPCCQTHNPTPTDFQILLCTGGPAVRIIGELGQHCEPDSCRIQYQDWGTPWTDFWCGSLPDDTPSKLLAYCQQHYFGE